MGATATYKPKKATFTVTIKNNKRAFTARNKRAQRVCKSEGKRKYLSLEQLRACKGKGTYKFYQALPDGTLKPIRL